MTSILEQAKRRLAEIEEEAATLRRMIAAAEKGTVQVAPAPAPTPAPFVPFPGTPPWPMPYSPPYQPDPLTPWIVGPKPDHGGMCACPSCCPPTFVTTAGATATLPLCLPTEGIIYGNTAGITVDRTRYTGPAMLC